MKALGNVPLFTKNWYASFQRIFPRISMTPKLIWSPLPECLFCYEELLADRYIVKFKQGMFHAKIKYRRRLEWWWMMEKPDDQKATELHQTHLSGPTDSRHLISFFISRASFHPYNMMTSASGSTSRKKTTLQLELDSNISLCLAVAWPCKAPQAVPCSWKALLKCNTS